MASASEDWREFDDDGHVVGRFDFKIEVVLTDEHDNAVTVALAPDPRRYTKELLDGRVCYRDKFLHSLVPETAMLHMAARQASGLPIYFNPSALKSTTDYANARKEVLSVELRGGGYQAPTETAAAQREFGPLHTRRSLSFVSVDICGSSAARRLHGPKFDRAQELLLRELATVVGQFNASILKLTGDGFIAYNDYPAFTAQCDATVDMGLSLIVMLRHSINPALKDAGLPEIAIRVGADYGSAILKEIVVPATGLTRSEVASDALNRSAKIEQSAGPNEFRIGRNLYELLHVQWLERCRRVEFHGEAIGLTKYDVFEVK